MGGIWAQVDMRFEYDEESKGKHPFWIDRLTPIQIATFDLDEYRRVRRRVHHRRVARPHDPEHGLRAAEMTRRLKLLFLVRLIPLAERNYNLVELGPARHRQELRGPGDLALRCAADRRDDGGEPLRPHDRPAEGHGPDLGRRRLRRGRRPAEDAQRGRHHDEDLLRVRAPTSAARRRSRATPASPCSATPTSRST